MSLYAKDCDPYYYINETHCRDHIVYCDLFRTSHIMTGLNCLLTFVERTCFNWFQFNNGALNNGPLPIMHTF